MFKLVTEGMAVAWMVDDTTLNAMPSRSELEQAFRQSPFAHFFWLAHSVKAALAELRTLTPDDPLPEPFVIAERRDARAEVNISADDMQAVMVATAAHGGQNLTPRQIRQALISAGVASGFNKDNALALIVKLRKAEPGQQLETVIACGRSPTRGTPARIQRLTPTAQDRQRRPKMRDDGSVDLLELGEMIMVHQGDPLARRIPPEPGQPGFNVRGEVLRAPPPPDVKLNSGAGSIPSNQDPDLLIADRDGTPVPIERGVKVDEVLVMDTIDVSTGHVRFEGSILIRGDIHEEMRVEADGDVHVTGNVESATVRSGGSVTVGRGIIGHEDADGDLSCQITAAHGICANLAHFARLEAKQHITLFKEAAHCVLHSEQSVVMGTGKALTGRLVGGRVSAGQSIRAAVIGTPAGARTQLDLSGRIQSLLEEIEVLSQRCQAIRDGVISQSIESSRRGGNSGGLLAALAQSDDLARQLQRKQHRLAQEIAALRSSNQVIVGRRLHSNVLISLEDKSLLIRDDFGPSRISLVAEQLQVTSG